MGGRGSGGGSEATPGPAATGPARSERLREVGPVVVTLALALAVLAGLAVLPARTWWTQRRNMNEARAELTQVEAEVDELHEQLELLQTDAEVERLARQDFDLVYPGEESYRLVPPSTTPVLGSEAVTGTGSTGDPVVPTSP